MKMHPPQAALQKTVNAAMYAVSASAAATICISFAVKITCKRWEPWKHHAICLSVETLQKLEQGDGFWASISGAGVNNMHVPITDYTSASGMPYAFCGNLTVSFVARPAQVVNNLNGA